MESKWAANFYSRQKNGSVKEFNKEFQTESEMLAWIEKRYAAQGEKNFCVRSTAAPGKMNRAYIR